MENCSICAKEIDVQEGGWSHGHNAEPVNDGRCCTDCNYTIVLPARLRKFHRAEKRLRYALVDGDPHI